MDKIIVSSKNNYNLDLLMEKINNYKKTNNVYFVGYTNAGKSSLLNKIIKLCNLDDTLITTSSLPATTIDLIHIKINNAIITLCSVVMGYGGCTFSHLGLLDIIV